MILPGKRNALSTSLSAASGGIQLVEKNHEVILPGKRNALSTSLSAAFGGIQLVVKSHEVILPGKRNALSESGSFFSLPLSYYKFSDA
ncbi:MAG TPA: hypothetical protein H9744_15750 [Candidatus Eisenbergiella stercoravium]|nr:hypothetical protein [Candidatus Eisenbergiella stercoravium]